MSEAVKPKMSAGTFLVLLIVVVTLLVQAGFEHFQLRRAQESLGQQYLQQQSGVDQAEALRTQLEGIAGATAELAEQGNPNAILIRDQLQEQGISIHPPKK